MTPDISGLHIIFIILILIASLYILSKSADLLVNNAVKLSKIWGISEVVIGATIVSLGTTLPELAASVIAALQGSGEFSVGNAIGSCITNTSLILGAALLFGIIPVNKRESQKLTMFIVASLLLTVPLLINYFVLGTMLVPQWLGIVMVVLVPVYMTFLIIQEKRNPAPKTEAYGTEDEIVEQTEETKSRKQIVLLSLMFVLIAAIGIGISANFLVDSASLIAFRVGIPEAVIASTLVAFGTSVPELTTAISATKSKHGGLALGNVLGANVLNILFVVGISSALTVGGIALSFNFVLINFIALALIIILFSIFAYNGKRNKITKREGILLLAFYIVYVAVNLLSIL